MSARPPEAVLWDFLRGAMMTRALGIVADLQVAQELSGGPKSVDELADGKVDPDTLYRLLRALASDGIFAEQEPRVFANTGASEILAGDAWTSFAHLFGHVFYDAVALLDDAVRDGRATFGDRFGTDFWSWLKEHPDERAAFDIAMSGGKERGAERLAELDWSDGDVVVDLGGGNGAMLKALLERRPTLRGIVFDLPETVRDESSFPPGLEFVAGDFFESVPRGDTYVTSGIIHDWSDERAAAILHTVRANAESGARFISLENVVPAGNEPDGAKWLDLLMLVLASGRERTEHEWRSLFDSAGFEVEQCESGFVQARCR
jgi:O-methyltransferase domain